MRTGLLAATCACLLAACRSGPPDLAPVGGSGVATTATETTSPAAGAPTTTATTTATIGTAIQTTTTTTTGTVPPTATTAQPTTPAARLPAPVQAPPVPLQEAVALVPGASTTLTPGTQNTVDPAATFRVVLQGTFPDARLSILDPGDAMLPAGGARAVGPTTTLTLQPSAPLRPGTAYRLRVDGATTREVKAKDGTPRAPVELPLLAAGEPPDEPKRRPAKKPKR